MCKFDPFCKTAFFVEIKVVFEILNVNSISGQWNLYISNVFRG